MGADELAIDAMRKKIGEIGIPSLECGAKVERKEKRVIEDPKDLAEYIDHSALKPQLTRQDIIEACDQTKAYKFKGLCVNPQYVLEAKKQLEGTGCLVVATVGFPLGMNLTVTKVVETQEAIYHGADEIDMVMEAGLLKSGEYKKVFEDVGEVVAKARVIPVKVIIEACLLTNEEKIIACLLAKRAGAAFVKTSTGFSVAGATVEDVKLMREVVGDDMGVKAAGGIKDYDAARSMVEAGADRLGCSASVSIVTEQ